MSGFASAYGEPFAKYSEWNVMVRLVRYRTVTPSAIGLSVGKVFAQYVDDNCDRAAISGWSETSTHEEWGETYRRIGWSFVHGDLPAIQADDALLRSLARKVGNNDARCDWIPK
ncbi:hypothetical protein BV898_11708 [Hypsibius exemplaris]|uniref:Uncharacterized protein n=1 Tax=Hypsibius exemplaris TaxID=2072580 RepID=A0A1W0WFT0_HYPEX|nr:hypothetical protein BV898_11708 [Hypsibius exemplaris]